LLEAGEVGVARAEGLAGAPIVAAHGPVGANRGVGGIGGDHRKGRHRVAHACRPAGEGTLSFYSFFVS
jgi:hypothetical protein